MSEIFALELYSVRTHYREDLPGCLRRVAQMGYKGVEFFGPLVQPAGLVTALLAETGLQMAGWHTGIETLEGDAFDETVAYFKAVGCTAAVVPWADAENFTTREAVLAFAARMDAICERIAPHGIALGYHNHAQEFSPLPDGTLPWAVLMDNSKVFGQLDNGNALMGTAENLDTAEIVAKWPSRANTVHLKPWSKKDGHKTMIGEDDIDWPAFVRAAKEIGGAKWLIVEYEEEAMYEQFDGAERCLRALEKLVT